MAAIILAIINLVIIILKAYLSGSVDRAELLRKVQETQDHIDKMAAEQVTEMREDSQKADAGLESMQDAMDEKLREHDTHK